VLSLLFIAAFVMTPVEPLRLLLTFLFLLASPGVLLVDWVDLSDPIVLVTFVVSSSLAVNTLVATVLVATGTYGPANGVASTAGLTILLTVVSYGVHLERLSEGGQ
jgi:hypothetical protein